MRKIPLLSLVLLIVASLESVRTLPTTAFFGSCLVFFYCLAAVVFLIPVSFISAEFSSRYPTEGGIFHWVGNAFGSKLGLLAVWLQWINTMVWYPTMLLFIAGTTAHLIHPELAKNKLFLLSVCLATFWGLTLANLRGIQMSVKINSFCGTIGTLIPMGFLILLGGLWFFTSHTPAIDLSSLIPSANLIDSSGALVTIMASFLGMELAGVHISDIDNPTRNFPKAIAFSGFILLSTLTLGSLAVAVVIPQSEIQFADGVMQTFATFFNTFGMPYLTPILAVLIILGATGGSVNWLLSPAKGLLQAAEAGYLPAFFLKQNRHGVGARILIGQAVVVSVFCFALQLADNINTYYWFLLALSTGLYMLMYIFLFLAALKLKRPSFGYQIPKGLRTLFCLIGLLSCLVTIAVGFQPAPDVVIGSKIAYTSVIICGFFLMLLPAIVLIAYQKKGRTAIKAPSQPGLRS